MTLFIDVAIIAATILGLWWGAVWVVEGAARIAKRLGLSELVIGLTVVAIGTSAPEFAVTVGAALNGQGDISVGNVVGSNIFNIGFILGGVVLVRTIVTSRALVYRDGSVLIGVTLLLLLFLSDLTMARWEGLILMSLLVAYIAFLIYRREPIEEAIPTGEFHWYEIPRLLAGLGLVVVSGHRGNRRQLERPKHRLVRRPAYGARLRIGKTARVNDIIDVQSALGVIFLCARTTRIYDFAELGRHPPASSAPPRSRGKLWGGSGE